MVVCHDGEVLAVARATGQKAKIVRERLGETENLPSVEDAMAQHTQDISGQFARIAREARGELSRQRTALDTHYKQMTTQHQLERARLDKGQALRWAEESASRAARFKSGLAGFWQRLNGQRGQITDRNVREAHEALQRDREQHQQLIDAQLKERASIAGQRAKMRQEAFGLLQDLRSDRDRLVAKLTEPQSDPPKRRRRQRRDQEQAVDISLDL